MKVTGIDLEVHLVILEHGLPEVGRVGVIGCDAGDQEGHETQ